MLKVELRSGSHRCSFYFFKSIHCIPVICFFLNYREILDFLKERNLTLENFSSIQEQQVGGWTQMGCHGTGVSLPTVEQQISELYLIDVRHFSSFSFFFFFHFSSFSFREQERSVFYQQKVIPNYSK